jgi:hypothetical protein
VYFYALGLNSFVKQVDTGIISKKECFGLLQFRFMGILLQNLLFKTIFERLKSAGMIISDFLLTVNPTTIFIYFLLNPSDLTTQASFSCETNRHDGFSPVSRPPKRLNHRNQNASSAAQSLSKF